MQRALLFVSFVSIAAWAPIHASAQAPAPVFQSSRPIRIIVPFPPGGVSDGLARLISYKLAYAVSAFVPVTIIVTYPNVLVANARVPVNTLTELIAYARANPDKLNYASQGSGTSSHLSGEMFKQLADVRMVPVPYKGTGPAVTDLVAGQVDLFFVHLASTLSHVKSGKLKLLATGGPKRLPDFPGVPAINEQAPGFVSITWMGLVAPPKTPPEIAERLAPGGAGAGGAPPRQEGPAALNGAP